MLPLYKDPHFTFRFADDRIIPRFHLEGIPPGQRILVFRIDPGTGEKLDLLTRANVGKGCWVDLHVPLIVRAEESFIAVPEPLNYSALKIMLTAVGVVGLLAIAGFLVGLIQGGGNQFLLAICCGALGAFVVLLGYGPVALVIGAFGFVVECLYRKLKGSRGSRS
jgi:hypothetical protein